LRVCIFDPIKARLASSCSKKGIREAPTASICIGETAKKLTLLASTVINSLKERTGTIFVLKKLSLVNKTSPDATLYLASCSAVK